MLILFETSAGFALFKVLDEGKLSDVKKFSQDFNTPDAARQIVRLKAFSKFKNVSKALKATTRLLENKPSKDLLNFLRANCDGETLGVADSKLGDAIENKLKIKCLHNKAVMELMRVVRSQLTELLTTERNSGLAVQDLQQMCLALSHSFSRYKLKDEEGNTPMDGHMVIQAIRVLDYLDKELYKYAMVVRECYHGHFPELAKIIHDNLLYVKSVKLMGDRTNAARLDFSEFLPEKVEVELKEASIFSIGTEFSGPDLVMIIEICDLVLSFSEYRAQLYDKLKSRMNTIAPNTTVLVGELVGARLIAHAGGLLNLAKRPGSHIQLLGAEAALFRALTNKHKTPALTNEHKTPKYGLLYHASLVAQAAPKHKGKMCRSLAAKISLSLRLDALGDGMDNSMGLKYREKLEVRLRTLEGKELGCGALLTPDMTHPSADAILSLSANDDNKLAAGEEKKKDKKKKKKSKKTEDDEGEEAANDGNENAEQEEPAKKEKKKKQKKKKKKHAAEETEEAAAAAAGGEEKKKKKRKHSEANEEENEKPSKKERKKKRKNEKMLAAAD